METAHFNANQVPLNVSETDLDVTAVTLSYLLCIFGGSLSVLIMCGNLLIIISIVYFKQLQTPTNYLMLSLAVADFLVGVFVLPFSILLYVHSNWPLQDVLCRIRGSVDLLSCSSSILNLCSISVDRYYAVCQPLRYRSKINTRVVALMILVTWTISALIGIIITLSPAQEQEKKRCVIIQNKEPGALIMGAFIIFFIPSIIMCAIYLKILMVAQRQARSIMNTSKVAGTVNKMERKATKTLAVVMGVFMMCWMPFFVGTCSQPLSNNNIPLHVMQSFKWLGWSNSMFNPCVYAFFYSWFRSAIRMIITGKIFKDDISNSKLN